METTLMDKTVGIIGLGIMGGPIARNLVERGWRVIGFDIEATKRTELPLANVEIAADVEQISREAPIIMTNFPSPGRRRGGRAKHREFRSVSNR
jgi:putative dehydrogenase